MNKIEIELLGKIKVVLFMGGKEIARHQDEGGIVRGYIECDDIAISSKKTFRQEIKEIHSDSQVGLRKISLDDSKPLRWPIWVGELSEITQDEVRED